MRTHVGNLQHVPFFFRSLFNTNVFRLFYSFYGCPLVFLDRTWNSSKIVAESPLFRISCPVLGGCPFSMKCSICNIFRFFRSLFNTFSNQPYSTSWQGRKLRVALGFVMFQRCHRRLERRCHTRCHDQQISEGF